MGETSMVTSTRGTVLTKCQTVIARTATILILTRRHVSLHLRKGRPVGCADATKILLRRRKNGRFNPDNLTTGFVNSMNIEWLMINVTRRTANLLDLIPTRQSGNARTVVEITKLNT
jgi:hypothetical protein